MAISDEERLRATLRKIEPLYAAAGTEAEKNAAGAAAERLRRLYEESRSAERVQEFRISLPDAWSRQPCVGDMGCGRFAVSECIVNRSSSRGRRVL